MLPVTIAVTEEPQNEYQPISLALAAQIEYSNRGIGTCDHDTLSALGVQDGDWVVLLGPKIAYLRILRDLKSSSTNADFAQKWKDKRSSLSPVKAPASIERDHVIRLDQNDAENLGAKTGDKVVAMPTTVASVSDWESVRLIPADPSIPPHLYPPCRVARGLLQGRLLLKRQEGYRVGLPLANGAMASFFCHCKGPGNNPTVAEASDSLGRVGSRTVIRLVADARPGTPRDLSIVETPALARLVSLLREKTTRTQDKGMRARGKSIVLVDGPPGSGKSTAVRHAAISLGLELHDISLGALLTDPATPPDADPITRGLLLAEKVAASGSQAILFADSADMLFPAADELSEDSLRVLALFLDASRNVAPGVCFVCAAPAASSIHPWLLAAVDETITTTPPGAEARRQMLIQAGTQGAVLDDAVELTQGLSFAEIGQCIGTAQSIGWEAAARLVRRNLVAGGFVSAQTQGGGQQVPNVSWGNIGGLGEVRVALEQCIVWRFRRAETLSRLGISPPKGVLLYGPPGTGKTLVAKAVANESACNFVSLSIPTIIHGEVGQSEKTLAAAFARAVQSAPCVLFFDEIQAIFGQRGSGGPNRKLVSQFFLELDSLAGDMGVVVLAATNVPHAIDPALLRPGRLDVSVYVPPPSEAERESILRLKSSEMRVSADTDLGAIARATAGFTGADLANLCRHAGMHALKRATTMMTSEAPQIIPQDFKHALGRCRPSVTSDMLAAFVEWGRQR